MSSISQYKAFVATVENRSLTRAAKSLNLSPSAVSKQISVLEASVGVALLERTNRLIKVTESGSVFYRRCKDILADIRLAEEEVQTHRDKISGKIKLTVSTSLANTKFIDLLTDFSQQHPDIRFDLNMTDEIEDLVTEQIDFAFRLGKLADNRLRAIPLFEVRPVFCASPDYIKRFGMPNQLADLAQHHITLLSTLNLSIVLNAMFNKKTTQIGMKDYHSTNDVNTIFQMVKKGLSIGALLNVSVEDELNQKKLIDLFPEKTLPGKRLYLVHAKQGALPKKLQLFKEYSKSYYASD